MKKFVIGLLILSMSVSAYAQTLLTAEETPAVNVGKESKQAAQEVLAPGHVNLDFKEADIRNVLRIIALKGGVNIVAGPEVTGTVTIRLQDVPWEKALEVVLKTYGYVFERDGNVVRVTTKDRVAQEDLETRTYFLNYTTAVEAAEAITDLLSDRGKVKAVTRTNTVIITDTAANLYKITNVVANLDKRTPQAYIDTKIIETQLDKSENLGINWNIAGTLQGAAVPTTFPFNTNTATPLGFGRGDGTRGSDFFPALVPGGPIPNPIFSRAFPPLGVGAGNIVGQTYTLGTLSLAAFVATLNFLKTRANTKIVSNPRIVVLNNQTAKVQVGREIYIPNFELNEQTGAYVINDFETKDIGVVLNVTPHINTADEILVEVKPEVSSQGPNVVYTPTLSAPTFNKTEASTQVLIKDGETIAIGGLMTDLRTSTYARVPILGDLPWIGNVFRSKRETADANNRKSETLFFVTVGIIDVEGQPVRETLHPQISQTSDLEAKPAT